MRAWTCTGAIAGLTTARTTRPFACGTRYTRGAGGRAATAAIEGTEPREPYNLAGTGARTGVVSLALAAAALRRTIETVRKPSKGRILGL